MNTIGDALNQSFAADAARENTLDARRAIGAIGRRRAVRAAGMGTAAAVGIGAMGAVWWFAPGGRWASPAHPAPSTQCTDAQLYLPPNPEAMGDVDLKFRAYVDLRPGSPTDGVVVVRQDGTLVRVEPGDDGTYTYLGNPITFPDMPDEIKFRPMVMDFEATGGGGDYWDGVNPVTKDYAWTMVLPQQVPDGTDTALLSSTLRIAMELGGTGYIPDSVPHGAVADEVLTTTSGETEEARLSEGDPGFSTEGRTDVASVALRVTMADGSSFALVANHHEVDPALTACASASTSVTATPTGSPEPAATGPIPGSSPDPGVSQGGVPEVLAGPESAVFACGAALPNDLEGTLGLDVVWASGSEPLGGSGVPGTFDFGAGGIMATGELKRGEAQHGNLESFNWASSGTEGQESLAIYMTAVAVKDDTVVGVVNVSSDPPPTEVFNFGGPGSDPTLENVTMAIKDVGERMEPCPGYVERELEGATTVALLGTGSVGGPYTFAWTPVTVD